MKVLVPPTERKVLFSIGTFFENYDITKRKRYLSETYSTVRKREKRREKHLMETTRKTENGVKKRKRVRYRRAENESKRNE